MFATYVISPGVSLPASDKVIFRGVYRATTIYQPLPDFVKGAMQAFHFVIAIHDKRLLVISVAFCILIFCVCQVQSDKLFSLRPNDSRFANKKLYFKPPFLADDIPSLSMYILGGLILGTSRE